MNRTLSNSLPSAIAHDFPYGRRPNSVFAGHTDFGSSVGYGASNLSHLICAQSWGSIHVMLAVLLRHVGVVLSGSAHVDMGWINTSGVVATMARMHTALCRLVVRYLPGYSVSSAISEFSARVEHTVSEMVFTVHPKPAFVWVSDRDLRPEPSHIYGSVGVRHGYILQWK